MGARLILAWLTCYRCNHINIQLLLLHRMGTWPWNLRSKPCKCAYWVPPISVLRSIIHQIVFDIRWTMSKSSERLSISIAKIAQIYCRKVWDFWFCNRIWALNPFIARKDFSQFWMAELEMEDSIIVPHKFKIVQDGKQEWIFIINVLLLCILKIGKETTSSVMGKYFFPNWF